VAKHLAARNHPTCDCCHDLPHRAVAVAFAMPAGGLVVRVVPGRGARAELGCHETEYFCTGLYIADGVEDRQFIPAMVMGDAPNADSVRVGKWCEELKCAARTTSSVSGFPASWG
jgi:hypothetical protein